MLNKLILWVVICLIGIPVNTGAPIKQTGKPIKKIERLIVERLPKKVVHIEDQLIFERRRKDAAKSERLLRLHGVTSPKIIVALLANCWEESRWSGENDGDCVGFYQLSRHTLGRGLTTAQLKNVKINTLRIIQSNDFKGFMRWCRRHKNADAGEISFQFATQVERCARKYRYQRLITARHFWRAIDRK